MTEAELIATTSNAQDKMYAKRLLECMDLQVKLPMMLEMDNKGSVELVNNYSVGGRTRHMETRAMNNCGEMDTWKWKHQ